MAGSGVALAQNTQDADGTLLMAQMIVSQSRPCDAENAVVFTGSLGAAG